MIGKWPGLAAGSLKDGRDLTPTVDLRAVIKTVLSGHMKIPAAAVDRSVLPQSGAIAPLPGLIA